MNALLLLAVVFGAVALANRATANASATTVSDSANATSSTGDATGILSLAPNPKSVVHYSARVQKDIDLGYSLGLSFVRPKPHTPDPPTVMAYNPYTGGYSYYAGEPPVRYGAVQYVATGKPGEYLDRKTGVKFVPSTETGWGPNPSNIVP